MSENIIVKKNEMKETEFTTVNEFDLVGSVVSVRKSTPNLVSLIIAVSVSQSAAPALPEVVFYGEETVDAIVNSIEVTPESKPRVHIMGTIQTKKGITKDGEAAYYQNNVGEFFALAPNLLEDEFGYTDLGTVKASSKNRIKVLGECTNVYKLHSPTNENAVIGVVYTLKTTNVLGVPNFPKIVCFKQRLISAVPVEKGDWVCAICEYNTKESFDDSHKRIKRENLSVVDMANLSIT